MDYPAPGDVWSVFQKVRTTPALLAWGTARDAVSVLSWKVAHSNKSAQFLAVNVGLSNELVLYYFDDELSKAQFSIQSSTNSVAEVKAAEVAAEGYRSMFAEHLDPLTTKAGREFFADEDWTASLSQVKALVVLQIGPAEAIEEIYF